MRAKPFRRILAGALTLCLLLALLPTSAFASTTVTPSPNTGNSSVDSLEVEYFSSTLYNWDESAANAATAAADVSTDYTSTTVAYSTVASSNNSSYTSTSYYYLVDGTYYPVYYTRSSSGDGPSKTTTYTLYYLNGSTYTQIGSTTNGNDTVTLYTTGGYEGKGFYFTGSGNKGDSVPSFSSWSGSEQNYMIYSGLAASKLSESSNAPFNDDTVNAANLFATDGSNDDYTDVYTNVQVPFVYDSTTGYYTLDSDAYGVYFANGTASSGATMAIADLPMGYYAYVGTTGYYYKTGFAPFNTPSSTAGTYETAGDTKVTGYGLNESMVYGFGMVTSVDFQMTDNGQINGEDIIFEFSGDDDVWVYIDGVLVLDIGGTHDAITGTINFRTGDVTLTANGYSYIGDKATGTVYNTNTMSQDNLYTALDTTLTGFASEGTHTLTIYYMDRGQGRTNCLIKFNLPQEDSLSVTKEIESTYTDGTEIDSDILANLSNIDFSFTLYNGNNVVANANYSLYDADGNFVQTGSTDSAGTFTLKNGYTAVFNDIDLNEEETSYKVVENLSSTRWVTSYSYTAYINSVPTNSGTVTGTEAEVTLYESTTGVGTDTSADHIYFTFTNQYVKGADPDVDVYDETIVLDYGLPVQVDVVSNDTLTLYGKSIGEEYSPVVTYTLIDNDENEVSSYEGTYGTAIIDENGKVTYTLTEDFCGIETVKYKISVAVTLGTAEGGTETKDNSATGILTIIPATSVYYEEDFTVDYGDSTTFTSSNVSDWNDNSNFITISTNNASFSVQDDGEDYDTYQETGFVGTTDDSTYGTDAVYLDNLKDSYGTSLKVDTSNGAAQYKYTLTGMGTTIYGRVSTETGYIKVSIYKLDEDGNRIGTTSHYYDTGEEYTTYETADEQVIDTADLAASASTSSYVGDNLYNIPIYQYTALDYGTYEVRIYVYKEGTITSTDDNAGGEFYLDGIRVFNPMGTNTDDNEGYDTAYSAYSTDGEAHMSVVNIRDKVMADESSVITLTDINGEITSIDDYGNIGPNQEFYLQQDYTVSFSLLNWSSQSYKLYLGLKAPDGTDGVTVKVGSAEITIGNSADCYHDISSYVTVETRTATDDDGNEYSYQVGTVTITGVSGLAALTNIKVTGTDTFTLVSGEDIDADAEELLTGTLQTSNTIYLVSTAYAASLEVEEEEEEPVVEEPAVFTPESVKTSSTYSKLLKRATVTVSTSTDVSYVTINGEQVTGIKLLGKMYFTASYSRVSSGTTYEVVCYDADGVASESYTVTVG